MIHERFSKMLSYASNQEHCRSRILAEYFGDTEAGDCGICDICLAKRKRQKAEGFSGDVKAEIIKLLSERNLSAREIVAEFRCDPQPLLDTLKQMHEEGSIRTDSAGVIHRN